MTVKTKKTPRKQKTEKWEKFSLENYQREIENTVHFSFKTVNSNASPGGIRLSNKQGKALPYVAASSLIHSGINIQTDYVSNSGKVATIIKQSRSILAEESQEPTNIVQKI